MGLLFHNYPGGYLIKGEENVKRLIYYTGFDRKEKAGRDLFPRYLQLEIGCRQCEDIKAIVDFYDQYHALDKEIGSAVNAADSVDRLYFTSNIDPYEAYTRKKQTGEGMVGGGCAPFGVALLKVSGLYDTRCETRWIRPITISQNLTGELGKVSPWSLILGRKGNQWVWNGFQNSSLRSYDPDLIWHYIGEVMGENADESTLGQNELGPWNTSSGLPLTIFRNAPITLQDNGGRPGRRKDEVMVEGVRLQKQ
ncbi:MAG: hypothetical protein IPL65_02805 [Lewinellaceae bacterium]|nr:hypothetical protein [Lewinellaceae bacterium]